MFSIYVNVSIDTLVILFKIIILYHKLEKKV